MCIGYMQINSAIYGRLVEPILCTYQGATVCILVHNVWSRVHVVTCEQSNAHSGLHTMATYCFL